MGGLARQQHFWELRGKKSIGKTKKIAFKKVDPNKIPREIREIWIPLKKNEVNMFSREEFFDLREIWKNFRKYSEYKRRRDESLFLLGEIEKIIEEETSFKEIKPDVSGELVEEVLKKIKEVIKRKKGEIIRKYYYGCDSIKSKRLFLFISIKKTGLEEAEVSYFVGDTKKQKIKTGNRVFHRVPEGAVSFHLTPNNKNELVPQYVFEFPYS